MRISCFPFDSAVVLTQLLPCQHGSYFFYSILFDKVNLHAVLLLKR